MEKRLLEVQRQNKQLDYELARENPNAPQVTSKVSSVNLKRVNQQHSRAGASRNASIVAASKLGSQQPRPRNLPSISASVDLTGRLGGPKGRGRYETLQTPGHQLRSNVDKNHGHLDQLLTRQENSVSKSLVVDEGSRFNSILPKSTRNTTLKGLGGVGRNINDVNISVIPPPTSIHQQDVINRRVRKFSAKMSTQIGSERGDSRAGGKVSSKDKSSKGKYLGSRNRRSITQVDP